MKLEHTVHRYLSMGTAAMAQNGHSKKFKHHIGAVGGEDRREIIETGPQTCSAGELHFSYVTAGGRPRPADQYLLL